ncbi:arginine-glutamic acid dipeptide repeats protein [Drosophila pseudoobscura]|uniref:Arginine-glutamic acid dipeptide repeats protein n=1 Tax=Drosophila pseudoobscura pseudoobscura TaxID=46245 RepID=A0A6I8UES9_DROPS|nr:arginine-glutamic acid dipeptide repeats protein [Drosophila pseudoobscura]XP_015042464.2 arginine-glutamic acid dipeptide repeats protein [Drosophila pseudoobscura]XP_033237853.1 arginine-glutamic acid dipeptide repeats protein [Drosophila pseudoobscura]
MKSAKRWLFMTATVLLLSLLACSEAALPFKKVSIAKTPAFTSSTTTTSTSTTTEDTPVEEEDTPVPSGEGGSSDVPKADNNTRTSTKNSKLTGIPQIDYIWDPNLPRELNGYNLSTYPFLSTVPPMDEIHFKCEGLHDGFYASIEYKCQIYHHCVYGIRHDFLCANFTAFDQRTFICHFASDVDCEGSQKYWNRNDALYMATTTTSTTTTTIAPPPTQPAAPRRRLQRPQRPLRRPYNRRPIDDYYYDEEDQYEDEYYERPTRRHKTRPRHRKPQVEVDYEDEYEEKRVEAEKPARRNRNRYRDEEESLDEDYEERPAIRRGKPTPGPAGRKVSPPRKPGRAEERRSFNEDRPLARRRSNERRTTPSSAIDDLDEYEKPYGGTDQEEAAEEQTPQKVKTTPKPLTEYITPKAAAASVYARPRAPPKIARPVPITEKKKYSYPVQKNTATAQPPSGNGQEEEDYSQEQAQEDDYEQPPPPPPARNIPRRRTAAPRAEQKPTRTTLRKPVTDKKPLEEDYDEPAEQPEPPRKRKRPLAPRSRAPAPDVDFDDEDYEESLAPAPVATAAPARGILRSRSKATTTRKPIAPRPRQPIVEEEDTAEPIISEEEAPASAIAPRTRANSLSGRTAPGKPQRPSSVRVVKRPFLPSRGGSPYLPRGLQPVGVALKPVPPVTTDSTPIDMGSTISGVRLLEHGAPLLRGRPDSSEDEVEEEEEDDDEGAPPSPSPPRTTLPPRSALPATPKQQQQQQPPKLNLDELYENDYDVTLNDALDPTLKPLSPLPQHQIQIQHSHPLPYQPQQQQQPQGRPYASAYAAPTGGSSASSAYNPFAYQQQYQHPNHPQQSSTSASASASASAQSQTQSQPASYHSDSYFSSTDIRRRAIVPSQAARPHRHEYAAPRGPAAGGAGPGAGPGVSHHHQMGGRIAQHFYDDFAY